MSEFSKPKPKATRSSHRRIWHQLIENYEVEVAGLTELICGEPVLGSGDVEAFVRQGGRQQSRNRR